MKASPTERTPVAGRQVYLSAGKASDSARNLLCNVSRSAMNRVRISTADSRLGTVWAASGVAATTRMAVSVLITKRERRGGEMLDDCRMSGSPVVGECEVRGVREGKRYWSCRQAPVRSDEPYRTRDERAIARRHVAPCEREGLDRLYNFLRRRSITLLTDHVRLLHELHERFIDVAWLLEPEAMTVAEAAERFGVLEQGVLDS